MWIVQLALRHTYTFFVAALLILILGVVTINRMTTDIFPEINIPVVSVIWSYNGISPEEMEKRIVTISERAFTTTVNDIEHMESQSMKGVSVIKVFFQPGAKIEAAVAQLTATSQTVLRVMPPGIVPPLILRYSASNVPILQMGVGSKSLSEQELYDLGLNFIRTQLATVQGASLPSRFKHEWLKFLVLWTCICTKWSTNQNYTLTLNARKHKRLDCLNGTSPTIF